MKCWASTHMGLASANSRTIKIWKQSLPNKSQYQRITSNKAAHSEQEDIAYSEKPINQNQAITNTDVESAKGKLKQPL